MTAEVQPDDRPLPATEADQVDHVDRARRAIRRAEQYLEANNPPVEWVREHVETAAAELDAHQEGQS